MSADAHPQSAWRLTLALLFLLGLTALEVGVVGLPGVDRAVRITALIGLGMTKGAVLLTAFMRMGREPLSSSRCCSPRGSPSP
jgi:heme/copper-type cytochrome/quinol oxidase subunit 4